MTNRYRRCPHVYGAGDPLSAILSVCPLSPSRTLGHEVVLFLMEPPRGVATLEHEVNFFSCFDAVRGFVKWGKSA